MIGAAEGPFSAGPVRVRVGSAGMSFDVSADAYDRFMGRYSATLSPQLADLAGVTEGQRAIDVGCGSGMLTAELVARLGADAVAAIDPAELFVAAVAERNPGVDVRHGAAERLPFAENEFDVALAQLVIHFMADPVAGLREMARVTRPGGPVAASVWDLAGGRAPITPFWRAAVELDAGAGRIGARGRASGRPAGALRGGGDRRRAPGGAPRQRRASHVRRLVGPVRPWGGAGGRLPERARH